jgi:cell wall-associated NlpC family hydrolase
LHGRQLPRDSWQQAELGRTVKNAFTTAFPGDLWFFSEREDRRVTHVGIAVAKNQMVHLSLARGGYAVDRLDDEEDSFIATLRSRFRVGKRLL